MAQLKHTIFFLLATVGAIIIVLAVLNQEGQRTQSAQVSSSAAVLTDDGRPFSEVHEPIGQLPPEEIKAHILARVNEGTLLSESEKQLFLGVLSGRQFGVYQFTAKEQEMIINALNQ